MRILDKAKLPYTPHEYDHEDGAVDGVTVAARLGQKVEEVFKTLVCHGHSGDYCVFVIPVAEALDLKKAARAAGEKSVEMIPVRDINSVTGYVRGGCSPIGMKKSYKTVFDESCKSIHHIIVSAGKIGYQIEMEPEALVTFVRGSVADIIK
ncbi:Cys-tRNA(Pro) deacylase [Eubacterium callanderi]|nr:MULTISPECIES: Cys-tRNA(Pro) deacylase [Eubacterium]MBS4857264.1 Cys-tRNA(Pro) deacylase [Eubacterium limosum]MDR4074536.1 Cys-tRNA(Pro) deacylase [Eubacterium sp.]MBO1703822.1 Cys-tRNA(Pro) deacylase [Eubacterium callanderi]MBU5304544.1 Cys-tRNA(Pro) deacylase [Eubacterium callanderi]MCB6657707.1 Cys-tRNA(Pro) deacylase [Eubacterium callanderi]